MVTSVTMSTTYGHEKYEENQNEYMVMVKNDAGYHQVESQYEEVEQSKILEKMICL